MKRFEKIRHIKEKMAENKTVCFTIKPAVILAEQAQGPERDVPGDACSAHQQPEIVEQECFKTDQVEPQQTPDARPEIQQQAEPQPTRGDVPQAELKTTGAVS